MIGACSLAPLATFIQSSAVMDTMTLAGTPNLPNDGTEEGNVLPGGFLLMRCNDGYMLASGQLNITCLGNTWTPLPTCVPSTNGGSMTTNTTPRSSNAPCMIDRSTTFFITNGYPTSTVLTYTTETAATGNRIIYRNSSILIPSLKDQFDLHVESAMYLIQLLVIPIFVTMGNGLLNHDA